MMVPNSTCSVIWMLTIIKSQLVPRGLQQLDTSNLLMTSRIKANLWHQRWLNQISHLFKFSASPNLISRQLPRPYVTWGHKSKSFHKRSLLRCLSSTKRCTDASWRTKFFTCRRRMRKASHKKKSLRSCRKTWSSKQTCTNQSCKTGSFNCGSLTTSTMKWSNSWFKRKNKTSEWPRCSMT